MRVVADRDIVLEGDVETLKVFTHDNQVYVVETPSGDPGAGRPDIRVELEFFS